MPARENLCVAPGGLKFISSFEQDDSQVYLTRATRCQSSLLASCHILILPVSVDSSSDELFFQGLEFRRITGEVEHKWAFTSRCDLLC